MVPKFQTTPRMTEILSLVDPLDERLETLRAARGRYVIPNPTPEIRELRAKIGPLMAEYWKISLELNAEWHAQKPSWAKHDWSK